MAETCSAKVYAAGQWSPCPAAATHRVRRMVLCQVHAERFAYQTRGELVPLEPQPTTPQHVPPLTAHD